MHGGRLKTLVTFENFKRYQSEVGMLVVFLVWLGRSADNMPLLNVSSPGMCGDGWYYDTFSHSCQACPTAPSYLCKTMAYITVTGTNTNPKIDESATCANGTADELWFLVAGEFCLSQNIYDYIEITVGNTYQNVIPTTWTSESKEEALNSLRLYELAKLDTEGRLDSHIHQQMWANSGTISGFQNDQLYQLLVNEYGGEPTNLYSYNGWPQKGPFIRYPDSARFDIVTTEPIITSTFQFAQVMQFQLATYARNGTFKGFTPLTVQLNQCTMKNDISEIWRKYGTNMKSQCFVDMSILANELSTDFYEPFLEDGYDLSGNVILRPFPVILKWAGNNNAGNSASYLSARRFFLMSNIDDSVTIVNDVAIQFNIQSNVRRIYPPYFVMSAYKVSKNTLNTAQEEVRITSASDVHPQYTFSATYSMGQTAFQQWFLILPIILGILALLFFISKVISIAHIDGAYGYESQNLMSIACALLDTAGLLFFVICFLFSAFVVIFFKWQKDIFWCIPPESFGPFKNMKIFMYTSLGLELLSILIHVFGIQTQNHFFLIDWESPHAEGVPISAWRRINVANEWGKILTVRSSNVLFTVIVCVFVLNGFDVELLSTPIPTTDLISTGESHFILRFGMDTILWVLLMVFQYVFFHFIYWRFYGNPFFNFLDLCSTSNISVFITTSQSHGYYLHGRCVHSHADVDMKKLSQGLADESEGLVGLRGLMGDHTEQVFECFFASEFSRQYTAMKNNILIQQKICAGRHTAMEFPQQALKAYEEINTFLRKFFDGSLEGSTWRVEPTSMLQTFFGAPPQMGQSTFNIIKDNMFKHTMLSGCEWYMMVAYMVLFAVIDIHTQSPAIAGFTVYIIDFLIVWLYERICRSILARTTLIDSRFIVV